MVDGLRLLIVGGAGLIGHALMAEGQSRNHTILGTHRRSAEPETVYLSLPDNKSSQRIVRDFDPDWIFFAAGMSWVDGCELDRESCYDQNVKAPLELLAISPSANLVYFSSEYVFDGMNGPYSEKDRLKPLSMYGRCKAEAESRVLELSPSSLVIRTTVVYGLERQKKNFLYQVLANVGSAKQMEVPVDQLSSPTYVRDLVSATLDLVERGNTGIFHIAGSETTDRFSFAKLICSVFQLDSHFIKPVRTSDLHQLAPRPLKAGLKIDKLEKTIPFRMSTPTQGLLKSLEDLNMKERPFIDRPPGL
jgi:dTDP-4-dehydrorhamnose reductase